MTSPVDRNAERQDPQGLGPKDESDGALKAQAPNSIAEETARELLAVEQVDRDAAADHVEGDGSHSGYMLGTMIREGRHDDYPLVQAFGRDRFTRAIEQCAEIVREAARTWQWEAEEDDGYAYRLKACAERRAQSPGTDDDCPQDGSCGECATEMHEHFETPASKERRRELRCLADAISALDPTTRATLTHPISREAVAEKARELLAEARLAAGELFGNRCPDTVALCAIENAIDAQNLSPPSCPGVVEALEAARVELMRGDFETGWCKCGDLVDAHNIGSGHSPVDEGCYDVSRAIELVDAALQSHRGDA